MIPGSKISGRFVAPIMKSVLPEPIPSISDKIWLITRSLVSEEPLPPEPRALAMESISSKNKIQGLAARALSNKLRTFASEPPKYIFRSSGPFTLIKLAPHSLAMAFAIKVLPQPGGP